MTLVYNSILRQGADWRRRFYLKSRSGVPVNLEGATAACQVRIKAESTAVLMTPDVEIEAADGVIQLSIPASDSSALNLTGLPKGRVIEGQLSEQGYLAVFDLEVKYADGTIRREVQGQLCISPEVTRLGATNG